MKEHYNKVKDNIYTHDEICKCFKEIRKNLRICYENKYYQEWADMKEKMLMKQDFKNFVIDAIAGELISGKYKDEH